MPEPSAVDQLADSFWERLKQLQPISATINGDNRYDDRLPDTSPEGRAELRRFADEMRKAGQHEEADKLLEEFRKRFPDYKVPEAALRK